MRTLSIMLVRGLVTIDKDICLPSLMCEQGHYISINTSQNEQTGYRADKKGPQRFRAQLRMFTRKEKLHESINRDQELYK